MAAAASTQRDTVARNIFGRAPSSPDRLPMLRIALQGAATACTEELRGLIEHPVRLSLQRLDSGVAGELFAAPAGERAIGMLAAQKWGATSCILSADRHAVFAALELLLGGDNSQPGPTEERQLTRIEIGVAGVLFNAIARALEGAFAPIMPTAFVMEATSAGVDFERYNAAEAMAAARFRFEAFDRAGEVVLAIPQSVIATHRKLLSAEPNKTPVTQADPRWTAKIERELVRTAVRLTAVLEERKSTLGDVAQLKAGQILELDATPQSRLRVECNGERLMWCHLGKSNGVYTLRVDEMIDREQDLMADVLSA